jgi:hypothetical protein
MQLLRRLLPLTLLYASPQLLPAHARALEGSPPKVQISLFNDAEVSPEILSRGQYRASVVLAQAGVQVEWVACRPRDRTNFSPTSPDCSSFTWPEHLAVRIVRRGISIKEEVFGQSFQDKFGCGIHASIYYDNLATSKSHAELSDADMLGFAIAHEIGHLLLGPHSHSAHGVMQGNWQRATLVAASQGNLFFSKHEANLIRMRLVKGDDLLRMARH